MNHTVKYPWVLGLLLLPVGAHAAGDAIDKIVNSPNYSTTYGARHILGGQQSITKRGYLDDTLRGDQWQRVYANPKQMQEVVNPIALIRSTQVLLSQQGLYSGLSNGMMNLQTHQAILKYQKQHKLPPSGAPSAQLWYHLNAQKNAIETPNESPHD